MPTIVVVISHRVVIFVKAVLEVLYLFCYGEILVDVILMDLLVRDFLQSALRREGTYVVIDIRMYGEVDVYFVRMVVQSGYGQERMESLCVRSFVSSILQRTHLDDCI